MLKFVFLVLLYQNTMIILKFLLSNCLATNTCGNHNICKWLHIQHKYYMQRTCCTKTNSFIYNIVCSWLSYRYLNLKKFHSAFSHHLPKYFYTSELLVDKFLYFIWSWSVWPVIRFNVVSIYLSGGPTGQEIISILRHSLRLNANVADTASQKSLRQFCKYCWQNLNHGKIYIFISNTFSM